LALFAFNEINNLRTFNVAFSPIPSADRENILTYLVTQFPPPGAKPAQKEEKPK